MPNPMIIRRSGGLVYPNQAAQFVGASSQQAQIADNASLSAGNVDLTLAGWLWADAIGSVMGVASKYGASGFREYLIFVQASGVVRFQVSTDGIAVTPVDASTFGAIGAGQWYFVAATYDQTNVRISINGGAQNSAVKTGTLQDNVSAFALGAFASSSYLTGRLDSWGFWKSATGAGGALSTTQISKLYKGGIGMAYRDLDSDLKTTLISFWNLDTDLTDSFGTNNLTNTNGITFTSGKR